MLPGRTGWTLRCHLPTMHFRRVDFANVVFVDEA
jgi:hypothetical protein